MGAGGGFCRLGRRKLRREWIGARVLPAPEGALLQRPGARIHDQHVSRRQAAHAPEQRVCAEHVAEAQVGIQRVEVQFSRQGRIGQDGLDLAGEAQPPVLWIEVQRLDADVVHRQDQLPGVAIPQGEGVHAAQTVEHRQAALLVEVHQRLGVAARAEDVPLGRQSGVQFEVVVDFAVEDDGDTAVFVEDRLIPARHVDDAQAAHPQGDAGGVEEAVTVRPAMGDARGHGACQGRVEGRASVQVDDASNATHGGGL